MKKGTKRKTTSTGIMEEEAAAAAAASTTSRTKRSTTFRPENEPEFYPEQHDFEDLWKQVRPIGIDWNLIDTVYQYNWNFSNLEAAFKDGGILHGKKVYLFGAAEARLIHTGSCVPVVVAVVSPFPPSDKIGVTSVQRGEEILDMKQMKMDWVPYIPLGKRGSPVERLKENQIFILSCVQRRAGLRHLKLDRVKEFEYCLPYFYNPLKEDEIEQSTFVDILYPVEPEPVVCRFDWEFDDLEELAGQLIAEEELSADQKDDFKEFAKEKIREGKRANREAREKRQKALEEISQETRAVFQNMEFYKFYPVATPDTPDFLKSPLINRYYGKAHLLFPQDD